MAAIIVPDNQQVGLIARYQPPKAAKKKESTKTAGLFSRLLGSKQPESLTHPVSELPFTVAEIAQLLEAVHEAGDALKKDASSANIINYKKAVRDFIHQVVEQSYELNENTSGRNILKRKKYTNIAIIDEKLERLAADIMVAQRDKLNILAKLDEIYGLLVDLLR